MNLKLIDIANSRYIWFILPVLVVIAPVILFGHPGYYGDDFNMLESLEDNQGIWGAVKNWIENYGYTYRPIGALFLYTIYGLFASNATVMYAISLVTYSCFIYVLFRESLLLSKDKTLSIFLVIFFSFFPFNPTAFLQLSSLYMMFTGLLTMLVLGKIIDKSRNFSFQESVLFSSLWLMLLFSYEQITGLIAVIFLLVFLTNIDKGTKESFKKSFIVCFGIGFTTLVFFIIFISSPGNPKMQTVKDLNQKTSITINAESDNNKEAKGQYVFKPAETNTIVDGRVNAIISKIDRGTAFLLANFSYSYHALVNNGWRGTLLFLILFVAILPICFISIVPPTKYQAASYVIVGLIWFSSTLAPFFLYKSVHIPPYVLLIPSIGMGVMVYGLYWLLWNGKMKKTSIAVFKIALLFLVISFPIQQYGYYFGLKEELNFWQAISTPFKKVEADFLQGKIIELTNINDKKNTHIFWIEKLVGYRYFLNLTDRNSSQLSVIYNSQNKSVTIIPEKTTGEIVVKNLKNNIYK